MTKLVTLRYGLRFGLRNGLRLVLRYGLCGITRLAVQLVMLSLDPKGRV